MIECPQCGRECEAGTNFCPNCGTKLHPQGGSATEVTHTIPAVPEDTSSTATSSNITAEFPTEVRNAIRELPKGSALLVVEQGPEAGARFLLDTDQTTTGRHPDSGIFLDDVTVSRHHARFVRNDQEFSVQDLGSLNGTYVNRRLAEGQVRLRTGDEVQIGKYRMIYCGREVSSEAGRS